jgi:hypothetical protein
MFFPDDNARFLFRLLICAVSLMLPTGDITFLSGTTYFGKNLTTYVENGTIPLSRVDDMGATPHTHLSHDRFSH